MWEGPGYPVPAPLAGRGYRVHAVDPPALHVEQDAKLDDPVFWPIVNHDNPDPADRPESSSLPTSTFSGANTPSAACECMFYGSSEMS